MRVVFLAAALLACASPGPPGQGEEWAAADGLFRGDARWVGGDGAYSVDLGGGRILWLFGDSFVATTEARTRGRSKMIRNSVALQTGADPETALLRFYWRSGDGEEPESFLAEEDGQWFWPEHGVRLGDRLLVFWERLRGAGEGPFGFEATAWIATVVDDPDAEPSAWTLRRATLPPAGLGIILGEAALVHEGRLYVYGTRGRFHDAVLARFELEQAARGELGDPEWWQGGRFVRQSALRGEPDTVVPWLAPEFSVHFDAQRGRFLIVQTEGFGATALSAREAPRPEGPWSAPRTFFRPPESDWPSAFVYAGKAHPAVAADGALAVTYVPSSFEDRPPPVGDLLYWPRFVRVRFP